LARTGRHGERYAEKQADPPGREDSPTDRQKRRILGVKDGRVADGEVFNADPGRDLVLQDTVPDGGGDA
jgi:hypothetical protein